MIKILVVDDEPLMLRDLVRIIGANPDFAVVGTAPDGKTALEIIKKNPVDVAFLDVEMPEMTGIETAREFLKLEKPPLVVFATAHRHYAFEAFNVRAFDYVVKPYDPARIQQTLERIKSALEQPAAQTQEAEPAIAGDVIEKGVLKKISVKRRGSNERFLMSPEEVYCFYAKNVECWAVKGKEEYRVNMKLKDVCKVLDPAKFVQTHRSFIVNLDKIKKVSPLFSGNYDISLVEPSEMHVPLARSKVSLLKGRLENW